MDPIPKFEKNIDCAANCTNEELLNRVVKYYGPILRTYFYNRLRAYEDVDDYLQELYYRILVYKYPSEIKSIQKFVFTIAVNQMRDRSRRVNTRMGKRTISLEDIDINQDEIAADAISPYKIISKIEELKAAQAKIERLPEKCKKAFWMHRIQGYTQKEISLKLGVTVSAIEKYMMIAKEKLTNEALSEERETSQQHCN